MPAVRKPLNKKNPWVWRSWTKETQPDGSVVTRQREKGFRLKKEAEEYGAELAGMKGPRLDPNSAKTPFGEYAAGWIDTRPSPRTKVIYSDALRLWGGALTARTLGEVSLDPVGVQRVLNAAPRGVQPILRNTIVGPMKQATKDRIIPGHWLTGLEVPKKVAQPKRKPSEVTRADLDKMAGKLTGPWKLLPYVLLGLGVRIGEAHGLRAEDFRNGKVMIERQRRADGEVAPLKGRADGEARLAPCPEWLSDMVDGKTGYLFPDAPRRQVERRFRAAADKAGLTGLIPHDLRHLFASRLLASDVPISNISKWLGHKSIKTTVDTYGHLMDGSADKAREVMADW